MLYAMLLSILSQMLSEILTMEKCDFFSKSVSLIHSKTIIIIVVSTAYGDFCKKKIAVKVHLTVIT